MLGHLGTYYVAKAGLKLTVILCLLNGRITGNDPPLLAAEPFNF